MSHRTYDKGYWDAVRAAENVRWALWFEARWSAAQHQDTRQTRLRREASQRRRERKQHGYVEHINRQVVFNRDGGVCQICHMEIGESPWHVDHIRPLAKGGTHEYANVQLAHKRCNLVKGSKYESPDRVEAR